jgi:hypothetical protein
MKKSVGFASMHMLNIFVGFMDYYFLRFSILSIYGN